MNAEPNLSADTTAPSLHRVRSLLMATDLSARSDRALDRALQLAGRHGARLTILNVVDEDLPASARDRLRDAARNEIEACVAKIGRPEGVALSIEVAPGKDYRGILDVAERCDADLIVLGIHRNETGRTPIAGTTMERVIRNGSRPALVVADRVEGAYEKVMIGVDFSVFSRFAIRAGFAVAPDAEAHIVHAFQVPFEGFQPGRETRNALKSERESELAAMIGQEMDALIASSADVDRRETPPQTAVVHGEVHAVLRKEIERVKPDLLVLGTHGRVGIAHMVLGSVAEGFLNQPPCDVLTVKAW